MNFAILGVDAETLELAEVIAASPQHQLVAFCEAADLESRLRQVAPDARPEPHWEALLYHARADAIIINSRPDSPEREDALRKLVQAGGCLILVHPASPSLFALELEMIRSDSGANLVSYNPQAGLSDAGPGNSVDQMVFDHVVTSFQNSAAWCQFARDALLMRQVMGPFKQISSMSSDSTQARCTERSVNAKTVDGRMVRWAMTTGGKDESTLHVTGGTRATKLTKPPGHPWHDAGAGLVNTDSQCLLEHFEACWKQPADSLPWSVTCQALTMADAVPYSLQRGRTVDLRNEVVTEEDTFKSMMAASGCVILMLALFVFFLATLIEGLQLPFRRLPFWQNWPFYVVVPMLAFLSLQTLRLVYTKAKRRN